MALEIENYKPSGDPIQSVVVTHENAEEAAKWCGGRAVYSDDPADTYVIVPGIEHSDQAMVGMAIVKNTVMNTFTVHHTSWIEKNYAQTGVRNEPLLVAKDRIRTAPKAVEDIPEAEPVPESDYNVAVDYSKRSRQSFDEVIATSEAPKKLPPKHGRAVHPSLFGKPKL